MTCSATSTPRSPRAASPSSDVGSQLGGRSCLVTGATGGIGLETALALSRRGAHVLLHGRTRARAEAAASWVRERNRGAGLEGVFADLSSLEAVRGMAEEVGRRHHQLDVLVNNAGLLMDHRELSVDGHEMTFAVNHLAPFLLTNMLLPSLQRSGAGRVVTVASTAHARGVIDFSNLEGERAFFGFGAYQNSKLMNVMFTIELARRLEGTSVTANCFHPGVIPSGLWRRNRPAAMAFALFRPLFPSAAKGADTAVYLAGSPEVAATSGAYFHQRRLRRPARQAFDTAAQQRLWEVSAEITGVG